MDTNGCEMCGAELIIACVLWRGAFRDRNYDATWVVKLRNMIRRHLSVQHRFVCLTNTEIFGIDTIQLTGRHEGWWAKMELFRVSAISRNPVLYFDLDLLIVDSITELALYPKLHRSAFCLLPQMGPASRAKGMVGRFNSSVMYFEPGIWSDSIWKQFDKNPEYKTIYRGDQDFLGDCVPSAATYPKDWFLKMRDCPQSGPPEGIKIVMGNPIKPDEAAKKFEWARKIWQ